MQIILDTESTGKLWYKDKLLLVGVLILDTGEIKQYWHDSPNIGDLRTMLLAPGSEIICHNVKYDILVLRRNGFSVNNSFLGWCTLVLSSLLDNRGSHALKDLALSLKLEDKVTTLKELIGSGKNKLDIDKIDRKKLEEYNAQDLILTGKLFNYLLQQPAWETIKKRWLKIEEPFLKNLIEIEWKGILIDNSVKEELKKKFLEEQEKNRVILKEQLGEININSPKQLVAYFFKNREAIRRTEKGNISINEEVLKDLSKEDSAAARIIELRKAHKIVKTYIGNIDAYLDCDRIHPNFIQHSDISEGAGTGRISCSRPNTENIPEHSQAREIRRIFTARPGNVFLAGDYSQIELRFLAHFSKDPALLDAFKRDKDLHELTAIDLFESEHPNDLERFVGKTFNFAVGFGAGVDTILSALKKNLSSEDFAKFSYERIRELISRYWKTYRRLREWTFEIRSLLKAKGYVETICGRRRYIDDIDSGWAWRAAVDTIPQGSAADLLKLATTKVLDNPEIQGRNLVHDSLVVEIPENRVGDLGFFVKKTMMGAMKLDVPIRVKVKYGKTFMDV